MQFHCVLARPPAPEVEDWKGTEWQCYIGQEAVDQDIISQGFLSEETSGPGRASPCAAWRARAGERPPGRRR